MTRAFHVIYCKYCLHLYVTFVQRPNMPFSKEEKQFDEEKSYRKNKIDKIKFLPPAVICFSPFFIAYIHTNASILLQKQKGWKKIK